MKKNNKKHRENLDEPFLEKMIRTKFDEEKKANWRIRLATEHGIERTATTAVNARPGFRRLVFGLSAAAAAVLLLMVAIPLFETNDYNKIVDQYLVGEKYAYGADRKNVDATTEAAEAYKLDDYEKAIESWTEAINEENVAAQEYFFLGLSYLYNQQPEQAVEFMLKARPLSIEEDDSFTEEINWFLGLAYIKAGDPEPAKATLARIKPNEWNYALAQQILVSLE